MDRVLGWIDSVLRKLGDLLGGRLQPVPVPVRVKGK
jgi:hypothetical protein